MDTKPKYVQTLEYERHELIKAVRAFKCDSYVRMAHGTCDDYEKWIEEIDTALKWIDEMASFIEENKRSALESNRRLLTADMGPYGRMK